MNQPFTFSGKRLESLLAGFKDAISRGDPAATKSNALVFVFGDQTPSTLENQRGQAVIQYLLQANAPVSNVCIIVSPTTTSILHASTINVVCGTLDNHNISATNNISTWKDSVKQMLAGKCLGAALKELELQEGAFATDVITFLRTESQAELVESAAMMGELLFEKDEEAQSSVEKAAGLSSTVFRRYVRGLLESQITKPSPDTLATLREQLCAKLQRPDTIEGLESLNASEFSMAAGLVACVFHKSAYDSRIQIDADELQQKCAAPLRPDVLTVRYGTKHFGFSSFIARTFIVSSKAPAVAKDAYEFVYAVSERVMQSLNPDKALKDVYAEVMQYASELNSNLAPYLLKSFGFSTGLLVLEARGTISEKGTAVIRSGMCFVVRIVLENVDGGNGENFSIELADTVIVRGGEGELRTKVFRKVEDVLYEDDGDEENEGITRVPRDLSKITRQGASDTVIVSREAQRDEQLRTLLKELHAEFIAAGGKKGSRVSPEEINVYEIGRLAQGDITFNEPVPAEAKTSIFINTNKKVAWFPVYGKPYPFHISTISKVETKREADRYVFVVTFHTLQEANAGFRLNRTKAFLKELTYASQKDIFTEIQISIHAIQQSIKNEDANRKRNLTSAVGGRLQLAPNAVRLPQIKMRPPITVGRKNQGCVGNLELHQNGLRFTYLGGTPVDILFDNVKHIIFQPAVNSVIVCYHITLKKSIDLGRKAATEIQFIAEVMESSEAATGARRTYEEEIQAEEREAARVRETNKQFVTFARAVEDRSKIRTQFPMNNLMFDGVHSKAMVTFKGSREVLWAISDWPAFTLSVSEIEVASLERVIPGNATFDLTFIMKDYNKPVVTINSIPRKSLEAIKDWCLAVRLYYMETTVNPNWKVALKDIREDEEWDPWLPGTGWSVLNNGDDEEDEEKDSDESDSTYYEEEDEETSDDDDSWLEDEESDISSASDSEDQSSVDWDELDKRAQEQDRKRRYSDDDDDRPRKKSRTTPAPAPSRSVTSSSLSLRRPTGGQGAAPPPRRF